MGAKVGLRAGGHRFFQPTKNWVFVYAPTGISQPIPSISSHLVWIFFLPIGPVEKYPRLPEKGKGYGTTVTQRLPFHRQLSPISATLSQIRPRLILILPVS
jgi:hypothetical protein